MRCQATSWLPISSIGFGGSISNLDVSPNFPRYPTIRLELELFMLGHGNRQLGGRGALAEAEVSSIRRPDDRSTFTSSQCSRLPEEIPRQKTQGNVYDLQLVRAV